MDRYLGGEDLDVDTLIADLETAVARGSPSTPSSALGAGSPSGFGTAELLEVIVRGFPSPLEHPLPCRSPAPDGDAARASRLRRLDGPLCAEVVKTTTDPYVGRVSLVRVFSGTLRPGP